jgi:outer membrane protein assembly factor BamB
VLASPRRRLIALVTVLAAAGAATAAYFLWIKPPADVHHGGSVEFRPPPPKPPPTPKPRPKKDTFRWPVYGRNVQHTRYLAARLRPPFRVLWNYDGLDTLEIQPILVDGILYVVNKKAVIQAIRATNGRRVWKRQVGGLSAAVPAYWRKRLFTTTLTGGAFGVSAKNGRVLWKKRLPSRSESSPIVAQGLVMFGSEDGTVYAVRARTGRTVWSYHAPGAVKGSIAYARGRVFFGSYAGTVTCLRARDGKTLWQQSESGLALGRSGTFYATPTLAYGRVYIGNTDGRMYSFAQRDGRLAWSQSTGNYVYAGAAVAAAPHTPPTVYVGSYDNNFYAFDAKLGNVRWVFHANNRISGAATVVGSVVYFSTLLGDRTYGLNVTNGRQVFLFRRGDYNPVISDGRYIYLTAVNRIFKLAPKRQSGRTHR